MLRIVPFFACFMYGATAFVVYKTARTLRFRIWSISSGVVSSMGLLAEMPALLTRILIVWYWSIIF